MLVYKYSTTWAGYKRLDIDAYTKIMRVFRPRMPELAEYGELKLPALVSTNGTVRLSVPGLVSASVLTCLASLSLSDIC